MPDVWGSPKAIDVLEHEFAHFGAATYDLTMNNIPHTACNITSRCMEKAHVQAAIYSPASFRNSAPPLHMRKLWRTRSACSHRAPSVRPAKTNARVQLRRRSYMHACANAPRKKWTRCLVHTPIHALARAHIRARAQAHELASTRASVAMQVHTTHTGNGY